MSGSKSSIISDSSSGASNNNNQYQLYQSRWILLVSVTLLNLANYSHWVSFASVAKQAAEYYQVTGPEVNRFKQLLLRFNLLYQVDLIPMVSYGLCVPFCLIAVYIVERRGLRFGLMLGSWLTAVGGGIHVFNLRNVSDSLSDSPGLCCLATVSGVWSGDSWWSTHTAFVLTVLGQALTGMGCPFISCVPTKVSQ